MKTFKREERYMVVKLSKLADDQGDNMGRDEEIYRIAHFGKALVEAVVIESDWPEYATVWKMIEDRVMGNPTPDHTNCHANGRKQAEQIDALQFELTKARVWERFAGYLLDHCEGQEIYEERLQYWLSEMLAKEANQYAPAENAAFNDPLYNAESDARNASALLEEVLEWFDDGVGRSPDEFKLMRKIGDWLGRSVPEIEDVSDECAHSEANKIGCPECGEEFKP